ncbi:MAG: glycosyltransferase family 2 protein [Candidatus Levybacteria bacterium]|nr:glycosyltransferase family 2 protein [Candidatus Levybacteria bacterium]
MKKTKEGISVFFPCYNDEKSIDKLVADAFTQLSKLTDRYEVIVIDDGSRDGSRKVLQSLAKQYKDLRLIFHKKNRGYGGALRSGFKAAKYRLVFYTDGDGQYDVKELPILVALMSEDVDFVNGIKLARQDPTYRIVIGNIYSFVTRWLFWLPIVDVDCDFRLIRKSILKRIRLRSNSGSICIELVKKSQRAGASFRQVSIHHYERRFGHSQFFRPKYLLRTFWELTSLWIVVMLLRR